MANKQAHRDYEALDLQRGWVRSETWQSPTGRHVERGTELSIAGERGRFRFWEHVTTGTGEWIAVIGGPGRGEHQTRQWRFFTPERVKTVHLKASSLTGAEARALILEKKRARRAT